MRHPLLVLALLAGAASGCGPAPSPESPAPAATTEEKLDSSDADTRREGLREAEEKYK